MSQHPLIPAKPTEITLDTLPQLFAHHRARFGGWTMTQTPPENEPPAERPEGVTEEEWNALGDPGRAAIVRERAARTAAERALAAAKAPKPTPPKQDPPPADPPKGNDPKSGEVDIAAIVKQAVDAAIKPFAERETARAVDEAAGRVRDAVLEAAKSKLHDPTDAVANIDLTTVITDQGGADPTKVAKALDDLLTAKPHLAKSTLLVAPPGIGGGAPANATEGEKVAAALARMQKSVNLRPPAQTSAN